MAQFVPGDLPMGGRKSAARSGRKFGEKVYLVRTEMDVSQASLARFAGVSEQAIASFEKARERPTPKTARVPSPAALARVLIACGVEPRSAVLGAFGSYEYERTEAEERLRRRVKGAFLLGAIPIPGLLTASAITGGLSSVGGGKLPVEHQRLLASLTDAVKEARRHPEAREPYRLFELPPREELVRDISRAAEQVPLEVLVAVADQLQLAAAACPPAARPAVDT